METIDVAAGHEARTKVRAMPETPDPAPGAMVQLIVDEGDHDGERLDAAAGCEFVDDRIRLLE